MNKLNDTVTVNWDDGFVFSGEVTNAYGRYWVNGLEIQQHGVSVDDATAIEWSKDYIEQLIIDAWCARAPEVGQDERDGAEYASDMRREISDRDDFADDYARDAALEWLEAD